MRRQKVFISTTYLDSDRAWTRQFSEALLKHGVDVWFADLNLAPGESIRDVLEKALRESSVVVLLLNRNNINNPNIFFELGAASAMGKLIVPIVAEDVPTNELPLPIRDIQFLVRGTPQETAEQLTRALRIRQGEAA